MAGQMPIRMQTVWQ